uniref:Uncharacterized protein n=1 Tax=Dicentrarchus labrax TaxID=13489 RepID=A0A8C4DL36_DICLA
MLKVVFVLGCLLSLALAYPVSVTFSYSSIAIKCFETPLFTTTATTTTTTTAATTTTASAGATTTAAAAATTLSPQQLIQLLLALFG